MLYLPFAPPQFTLIHPHLNPLPSRERKCYPLPRPWWVYRPGTWSTPVLSVAKRSRRKLVEGLRSSALHPSFLCLFCHARPRSGIQCLCITNEKERKDAGFSITNVENDRRSKATLTLILSHQGRGNFIYCPHRSPHRFACGLRPFDKLPSTLRQAQGSGQAGQALVSLGTAHRPSPTLKGGVIKAGNRSFWSGRVWLRTRCVTCRR